MGNASKLADYCGPTKAAAFRSVTKGEERTTGRANRKTITSSKRLYDRVLPVVILVKPSKTITYPTGADGEHIFE